MNNNAFGSIGAALLLIFATQALSWGGSIKTVSEGVTHDADGVPLVALTFDDGPHKTLTASLLDILAEEEVVATFYVVGRMVEQSPDLVSRMAEEGHEIGNHTWSHPDLRKLSAEKIRNEIARTSESIREATGSLPYSIRPPYGAVNDRVLKAIPEESAPVVMWTVDPHDWKKPGKSVVEERVVEKCRPGAIILLHDIHEGSVLAVRSIIRRLKERGYRFATVSQMLPNKNTIDLN